MIACFVQPTVQNQKDVQLKHLRNIWEAVEFFAWKMTEWLIDYQNSCT